MNMSLMRSVIGDVVLPSSTYSDVAGVQPPVGVDGLGGGLGVVEVADHHLVAARDDLARLAGGQVVAVDVDDLHLDAVERARKLVWAMISGSSSWRHMATGAGGLGEPVTGDDGVEAELLALHRTSSTGTDRSAGDGQAQATSVVLAHRSVLRMVW